MKRVCTLALLLVTVLSLSACARLQSGIHDLHGSIVGNEYYIDIFDNTGVRTLKTHGKKIDIDNNIVEEKTYSSESDSWLSTKTLSSVITITIDGKQLVSVGIPAFSMTQGSLPSMSFTSRILRAHPRESWIRLSSAAWSTA